MTETNKQLEELVWQAVQQVQNEPYFPMHPLTREDVVVTYTKDPKHGDYTTNVAFKFKPLTVKKL